MYSALKPGVARLLGSKASLCLCLGFLTETELFLQLQAFPCMLQGTHPGLNRVPLALRNTSGAQSAVVHLCLKQISLLPNPFQLDEQFGLPLFRAAHSIRPEIIWPDRLIEPAPGWRTPAELGYGPLLPLAILPLAILPLALALALLSLALLPFAITPLTIILHRRMAREERVRVRQSVPPAAAVFHAERPRVSGKERIRIS